MVLSIFGDESSDQTKQRVFAISAVFGTAEEWRSIEKTWLWRTGGKEFHAADAEHNGEHELIRDLTQILANTDVAGITVVLDLAAHREFFPDVLPDSAYYKCLSDVLTTFALMVHDWNAKKESDPLKLEFTFDHRRQSNGNAGALYSMLINLPEWGDTSLFGAQISFDSRTNPKIQVADLLAREAMKEFDRKISNSRPDPRKSFQALQGVDKFRFIERDRAYCKEWHDQMDSLMAENGMSREGYVEWLTKTKRVQNGRPHDNWGNRIQYLAWLESKPGLPPMFRKKNDATI